MKRGNMRTGRNGEPSVSQAKQKALQYAASVLIYFAALIIMVLAGAKWGHLSLPLKSEELKLAVLLKSVRNLPLAFGIIDLFPMMHQLICWKRLEKQGLCEDPVKVSLLADWKTGERSPVRMAIVFLVLTAGLVALFFAINRSD